MTESWLQRNWRPVLMLAFAAVVVNAYMIAPYLAAMGVPLVVSELPAKLWDLITMVVGGYVAGRTGEKITAALAMRHRDQKTMIEGVRE